MLEVGEHECGFGDVAVLLGLTVTYCRCEQGEAAFAEMACGRRRLDICPQPTSTLDRAIGRFITNGLAAA